MATPNDVLAGMVTIVTYARSNNISFEEGDFNAEHKQIWCGKYSGDIMSEADKNRMKKLGWFEDEDSWSKFT